MRILTVRGLRNVFFNQVMFEWEDDISMNYNIEKSSPNSLRFWFNMLLVRVLKYTPKIKRSKHPDFAFLMHADAAKYFIGSSYIPFFLDTWWLNKDEKVLSSIIEQIPEVIFSNYGMCESMRKIHPDKTIHYVPLGISSKWIHDKNLFKKSIHVVQVGRYNKILHEWMLNYCSKHPSIEYVYRESFDSGEYISTIRGKIGKIETREQYMQLLQKSKISLVSTPGCDDKGNISDSFTPRFYESASAYCHLIGRYTENTEAALLSIHEVCKNIKTQEEFELAIDYALQHEVDVKKYKSFLYDTSIVNRLKNILNNKVR